MFRSESLMCICVLVIMVNFGFGFDLCGLVLMLYLMFDIGVEVDFWYIEYNIGGGILYDEINVIIEMVLNLVFNLMLYYLVMICDILLVCGFGSSFVVVVVGIELVNIFVEFKFLKEEKVWIVVEIEGYFDNVVFVVFGNWVVGVKLDGEDFYVCYFFLDCVLIVFILKVEFFILESCGVLFDMFLFKEVV